MKFEPGDLLIARDSYDADDLKTRLVIKTQPYFGLSEPYVRETETLLMHSDGSMSWYSTKYIEMTLRKVESGETR